MLGHWKGSSQASPSILITTVIEAQARKLNEDRNKNSDKVPYDDKKGNSDKTNLGTRESGFPS